MEDETHDINELREENYSSPHFLGFTIRPVRVVVVGVGMDETDGTVDGVTGASGTSSGTGFTTWKNAINYFANFGIHTLV